jgi:hypothetical protein
MRLVRNRERGCLGRLFQGPRTAGYRHPGHSPALTAGKEPRTVTWSRCPGTFTRSTATPLSSLKKVTRSTSPAISSEGVLGCGEVSLMLVEVFALEDKSCWLKRTLSTFLPVCYGSSATELANDCASVWWRCAGKSRCTARITGNHRFAKIKLARPKEGREVTSASAAH